MAKIRASAAPFATKNTNLDDIRRSVTYHPSVWRDHFLSYTSDITEISAPENEQLETQRRKVNDHLTRVPQDSMLKMELIDAIQRLGVGYHFQKEIDDSLQKIRNTYQTELSKYNDDLHVVSLRFRLLRQQGYHVSCDVFNKFIDSEGNFKESLVDDVRGMLSLYEASNYGVLNGEEILDKALQFSSSNLKCFLPKMSTSVRRRVKDALEMPISKTLIRFGARKFISIYQEDESHNQDLLNFAKMDFNVVQKIHKKELNHITSWWKELDFANKLPFARDRVVEGYFWTVGVYFEPHYMIARRFLTKTIAMVSILDDIYDVHGTLDDLRRFTHSIPSWDITAFDELPPYMRLYYQGLLSVYAEMEEEMVKHGQSYRIQYAKQEMIKLSKAYMEEAEWCYSNYIRRLDEYIKVGVISSSHISLLTTSLIGIPDHITKHDFDWMANIPPIAWTSGLLGRLMDDLAGNGIKEGLALKSKGIERRDVSQYRGCGFASKHQYLFGRVSMKIKLVPGDSAGTVTAFYMNSDTDNVRDELDFEFLGNRSGQPYTVQTNVFAHGQGNREQRINLWFDPSLQYHTYSILWNHHQIVFSVDEVPIRVYKNNEAKGIPFPKFQPMGVYSTLWEADDWATRGGLEKIDWSKAPFYAYYKDFDIEGCAAPGPATCASNLNNWWEGAAYQQLSPEAARRYRWVRLNHMIYDYCTDKSRFPVTPPECVAGI